MGIRDVHNRRLARVVGVATTFVVASMALAACSGPASTSPATPTAGGASNGTLTVALPNDVVSLDPQLQGDMVSMSVADNIFDTLTVRESNDQLGPGLATKWKQTDPLTWQFTIRKGVKFQDGEPMTAGDVAYSINRLIDPATKSPIVELVNVKQAVAVNSDTVDFQMKQPDPVIPAKVSLFGGVILPQKLIEKEGAAAFAAHPVGTGPYSFVSHQADSQIVLKANPNYWGQKAGVKNLVFKIIPNPATALAALQSGQVSIVVNLTKDQTNQVAGGSGIQAVSSPGIRNYNINFDTESSGPLSNVDVRQAVNYALDVPTLVKTVLSGGAKQSATLIPTMVFGYDKSVAPFPFDAAKAKQLLAKAGYSNGFTTTLAASSVDSTIAQAIAGQLEKVGIKVNVNIEDPNTFKAQVITLSQRKDGGMYLVANSGWTLDANSYLQSNILPTTRSSRWNNDQANTLFTKGATSTVPAEREDAYAQLQSLLKQQAPFGYLFTINNTYAMASNVKWKMPTIGVFSMASARLG